MTVDWVLLGIGVASGLGLAGIYTLIATSYNLGLAVAGVFNMGVAGMISTAAAASYALQVRVEWHPLVALLTILLGGAVLGWLTELICVRRFVRASSNLTHDTIVTTLGISLVAGALLTITFGSTPRRVPAYVSQTPVRIGDLPIPPVYIAMFVIAALVCLTLDIVLRKTSTGLILRATAIDRDSVSLSGIDPRRVLVRAFVVAGILAAFAGFLIAPVMLASPFVGEHLALFGFAALSAGGYGSFRGAMVGGLMVGLIYGVTPVFVNAEYGRPIVFVALLVFLVARPAGMFGERGRFGAAALRDV